MTRIRIKKGYMPKVFNKKIKEYAITLWKDGLTESLIVKHILFKFETHVALPTIYTWVNHQYPNVRNRRIIKRVESNMVKPSLAEIIKGTTPMTKRIQIKKGIRRKNLVPNHIYAVIREYSAKGYSAKKVAGIVRKEFPDDIKIPTAQWEELVRRTRSNTKLLKESIEENDSSVPDELGLFPVLDGTEEVSNVHPTMFKPNHELPVGAINTYNSLKPKTEWEVNTAVITTENGDKITLEFSNKTLKQFIKDTLS